MSIIRANRWETASGNAAGVLYVDTIADLQALDTSALVDGQAVQVKEYHAGTGVGGGKFWWDGSLVSQNDGGSVLNGWVRNVGTSVTPEMFGAYGDGVQDDAECFTAAISYLNSIGGGDLTFTRQYGIGTPVDNIQSFTTITGKGVGRLINLITSPRGTEDALFKANGSYKSMHNLNAKATKEDLDISITNYEAVKPGDMLAMQARLYRSSNLSLVEETHGDGTITLDRPVILDCEIGADIRVVEPVTDVYIGDFYVDFNGTSDSPRYGGAVNIQLAKNCTVSNINSKNIGSKVVLISGSMDCTVDSIYSELGTDVDAGHGYVVRLAVCNDCLIARCKGSRVRHVVDLSGACRNKITDCVDHRGYSAGFLTHGNDGRYNQFINNDSYHNQTAAYSFNEEMGDIGNVVDGGYITDAVIKYHNSWGDTLIKNIVYSTSGTFASIKGEISYENCRFEVEASSLIRNPETDNPANVYFKNCTFIVKNAGEIIQNNAYVGEGLDRYIFKGCDVYDYSSDFIMRTGAGTDTVLDSCEFYYRGDTPKNTTNPIMSGSGNKELNKCKFYYDGSVASFLLGSYINCNLSVVDCDVYGIADLIRRYESGSGPLTIGPNKWDGVVGTPVTESNMINLSTVGGVYFKDNYKPSNSYRWIKGSKVIFHEPDAEGYTGMICISGTGEGSSEWVRYGKIEVVE